MLRAPTIFRIAFVCLLPLCAAWAQESSVNHPQSNQDSATLSGTVPRLVSFSGAVKDAAGKPLTGPVDIHFAIYKNADGVEPLWFETQTVELDAQGRYTVLLGAMRPEGLPPALFTTGKARWLEVMVASGATQPRVLLVSVPYAFMAADAQSLGGKPATAYVASDQLKEQVESEVKEQLANPTIGLRSLEMMVTNPASTPRTITETNPSTFTCSTSGTCVAVTQNGTGYPLTATSTATSGVTFGMRGQSNSTGGRGVYGYASALTGTTYGVLGSAASTEGRGVYGYASATWGSTIGVLGYTASRNGTGVHGTAAEATGSTVGVRGYVISPYGTAGLFDATGGGWILRGRGANLGEKFSVGANGNVWSAGSVSGGQLVSGVATGTAPLRVLSKTMVPNLNAEYLHNLPASAFAVLGANFFTAGQTINSGDLSLNSGNVSLPPTFGATVGVINLGGTPFIHACCGELVSNTFVGPGAGNFTTTGSFNTASGYQALASNTTGGNNTAGGYRALYFNTTGNSNTAMGFQSGPADGYSTLSYTTAIGAYAQVTQSHSLILGGTGTAGVNVGIGVTAPSNILTIVQNSATDPIADAWTTYSSRRWKTHIRTIDDALNKVKRLRGVYYDAKSDGQHNIGLIAEEVGEVVPEVVAYETNGVDAKSVDYARLTALLIEAVKEQQADIRELKAHVERLTAELADRAEIPQK